MEEAVFPDSNVFMYADDPDRRFDILSIHLLIPQSSQIHVVKSLPLWLITAAS